MAEQYRNFNDENYEFFKKQIDIIGDELIRQKLHEKLRRVYGESVGRDAYLRRIDDEINRLKKEKERVLRGNDSDKIYQG